VFKRKTEDKYDKGTLKKSIYEYRAKKARINSVAKKYGVPRTTLQYRLHKDFPPLGLQNKGRFKRVFTPDLENQLREHAVTLQKMFYGVNDMDMRMLAFDFEPFGDLKSCLSVGPS
jgi:hypothetical protein